MKTIIALLLLLLCGGVCNAQQSVNPHGLGFTLDPARTEPGTIEVEVGTSAGNSFDLPWVVKFTGDTGNFLFHNTEWALSGGLHGDSAALFIRRPIYESKSFALAVSPRMAFSFNGDTKPLPGLAILASVANGLNSLVVNGEVNQTTGVVRKAVYGDYSRYLGTTSQLEKLYVFVGLQAEFTEKSVLSTGYGIAYRAKPSLEFEFVFRQLDLSNERQNVFLTAVIANLGRIQ